MSKFIVYDKVTAEVRGVKRPGVVVAVYPEDNTYQVSILEGGGFHIVPESALEFREED